MPRPSVLPLADLAGACPISPHPGPFCVSWRFASGLGAGLPAVCCSFASWYSAPPPLPCGLCFMPACRPWVPPVVGHQPQGLRPLPCSGLRACGWTGKCRFVSRCVCRSRDYHMAFIGIPRWPEITLLALGSLIQLRTFTHPCTAFMHISRASCVN